MRTVGNKRRKWGWFVALGLVFAVIVIARLRPPLVQTLQIERKDMTRTVVVSGRIMSPAEIKVGAQISGTVAGVFAREGDRVKAGDLLVQLDDSAAKAQEKQALARLAEAQAGRLSVSSRDVPAATRQLERAKTLLEAEERAAERALQLGAQQAIPPTEVEQAQTNLELARNQVRAAQLELDAVSKGGSAAQRATASLSLAKANVDSIRVDLELTKIRAPSDGVILERKAEAGDLVTAGTSLFVISATGASRAVIEPDERSLADLKLGQTARVSTEAFPNQSFDAQVSYIAPAVNPKRGTIEVRLDIPNPPDYLRPDMTVSVEVVIGEQRQVVVVPRHVVKDRAQSPHVLVIRDSQVERRPIQLGPSDDTHVKVESGLEPGEVIVLESKKELDGGQRVRTDERAFW